MTTPNFPPQWDSNSELLTIVQFAERLQMSRATVFSWIHRGILVQGKHFLKFGKVVRFVWSDNLLELLMLDCAKETDRSTTKSTPRVARQTEPSPVNWEY